MKKFKVLIGKHYQLLSLTETNDSIPDDEEIYYAMEPDMRLPDFVLIRAENADEAEEKAISFIDSWKNKHRSLID